MHAAVAQFAVTIPRAPRIPSDLALLDSVDPVSHTLVYFAARKGRPAVAVAKAAATEGATQIDA